MTQCHIEIPKDRIQLNGCSEAEPLKFLLSTALGELFVPSNDARTDLALSVTIQPEQEQPRRKRDWAVPFSQGIRIDSALLIKRRRKLKACSPQKLLATEGSVRRAIERSWLDWVGPQIRVRVLHFPKGYGDIRAAESWRIEVSFCGDVIAQWNGSHEIVDSQKLFTDYRNPLT